MLRSSDEWLLDEKDDLEAKIERAFLQFDRGEFFSEGESRTNMEKRKGDWCAKSLG